MAFQWHQEEHKITDYDIQLYIIKTQNNENIKGGFNDDVDYLTYVV